jgi:hypothetical protein
MATEAARLERKESTGGKEKNTLDSYRPSHGRHLVISVPDTQTPGWAALLVEIPALWKWANPAKRSRGIT